MREQFEGLKLPMEYKSGVIKYEPTLDGIPDFLELLKMGFTKKDIEKINKLVQIEELKYLFEEQRISRPNDVTTDDEEKYNTLLSELIKEYNSFV